MGMRVDIVTLFPEMCQQVLDASIIGHAAKKGFIETHCHQIRDYTLNKQKQTDDYPYEMCIRDRVAGDKTHPEVQGIVGHTRGEVFVFADLAELKDRKSVV